MNTKQIVKVVALGLGLTFFTHVKIPASTPVLVESFNQLGEVKAELKGLLHSFRSINTRLTLNEQMNLVKKITDWVLKYRAIFRTEDLNTVENELLKDMPQEDMGIAKAFVELARYSCHLTTKDIYAILSYHIDLEMLSLGTLGTRPSRAQNPFSRSEEDRSLATPSYPTFDT
ncbi:MAG: hypothetical protein HYS08_10605 [Chlamydiae bacterium]|nr:hypothetical protein [Chlamydiota bacterium]